MNTNNAKMFNALRAFDLPIGEYLIIGSGPLGIRNIKAIGDIDIVVTSKLWNALTDQYGITQDNEIEKIVFPGGIIEAFPENAFNAASRIANAEIIDGLPFDTLKNTLIFKRKMGREKDLHDIRLVEIDVYKKRLKLQDAIFTRIDHADAMVALVYKVKAPACDYILKVCERPKDYANETHFLQFFKDKLPVPRILQLIEADELVPGAILMEYLPGVLLSTTTLTNPIAYEMGENLARIHINRTSGSNIRSDFTLKFEEGMDENKDHLPQELLTRCREYFDTHIHLLDSVDGPCILHRDFRAGNILVHEGKISGIIDWSSARSSFAEDDFCPLEHGEFPLDESSKTAFLSGYASIRPVPNYQAIMPFLRLNKALATVGYIVKKGTFATRDAKIYQYNRDFLDTFFK